MTAASGDAQAAPGSRGGPGASAGAWCDGNPLSPLAVFLRVLDGEPISAIQVSLPDHLDAKEGFVDQAEAILPHLDRRLPGGVRVTARRPNGFRALQADCLRILECHPQLRLTGPLPRAATENRARYQAARERAERAARLHEQGLSWTQIAARIGVIRESARHIVLQHESALRHSSALCVEVAPADPKRAKSGP
ncbi:MAG TPA: hypothetical protein VN279_12840 [Rhodocyclaceae bacterium]|nr:hypothetical protein [Rhodocyclaceae bacterium]